jgi:two-component system OmpR family sensor kinase
MKGGLFLKILLGFWLTLYCIIWGLWLVFVAGREGPSPEEWVSRRVAPAILSQLARQVARDGPKALEAARHDLPPDDARQIAIHAMGAHEPRWDKSLNRAVTAPDGRHYLLTYRIPSPPRRNGPVSVPQPVLIVAAVAGLTFSIILAWYLTRPINLIRKGFDQLAQGRLDVRLRPLIGRRRDEIASLARDFDTMAARLAQLVTTRDRLLHDVSHELRSPLSRMQLAIGLTRQDPAQFEKSMDRIEREMVRLDALVRELLVLARAESGIGTSEEYFDPIAMLESVAEDARFEAEASDVRVTLDLPAIPEERRPNLGGSAELFRRALENIVRNALRFSPKGSTITLAAALESDQSLYRFTVSDQGPGLGATEFATLLEPFVKGDQPGFGLGLAIAKRAVAAHGGTITAQNLPTGGLAVIVTVAVAGAA